MGNELTLQERIDLYLKASPKHEPLYITKSGRVEGFWTMGANYRVKGGYGAYPYGYLARITSMFPDQKKILHVCSGWLPKSDEYDRLDINPEREPEFCCDAQAMSRHILPESYDIIYIDTPYSDEDAVHYGYPMLNRKRVLLESHKLLKPGGWFVMLDQVPPIWAKRDWFFRMAIGIMGSTNHRMRVVLAFQKKGFADPGISES